MVTVILSLQILDKTVIGTAVAFGLRRDANLVGNDYSNMAAIGTLLLA